MKLVIVESPAKCDTIQKYLGNNYVVMASKGQVRDLANSGKGGLGVDVENNFTPNYIINKDKYKLINELKAKAKECDEVILATDPDREGEAIAWHLATVLGLDPKTTKRLEFHEITKGAILKAIENPRTINENLVASQESRRIIDRFIGYKLSNLIYKRIKAQSAGRVQSATLKFIAEHEKEISNFVPETYWNITCTIDLNGKEKVLNLVDDKGKTIDVTTLEQAQDIFNKIGDTLSVVSIKKSFRTKESKAPLTTSSLQQEAFAKLKMSTGTAQSLAQKLYQGVKIAGEPVGLITYIRTDLPVLSTDFVNASKKYIEDHYGNEYVSNSKKVRQVLNAQGAHEAIHQTSNDRTPEFVKPYLSSNEYKLYKLIYNHTLASLMKGKKEEVLTVLFESNGVYFSCEFSQTVFDGFEILDDKKEKTTSLPNIGENQTFAISNKTNEEKSTQPPAHLTEAKVVKIMEELGIGRPSTYVPTIKSLLNRKYISNEKGTILITPHGDKTSHVLVKYFPDVINEKYTADLETKLDEVQNGLIEKNNLLSSTYNDFKVAYDRALEMMYSDGPVEAGRNCPLCGKPLVIKKSKHGEFVGCSDYPKCRYIEKEEKEEPTKTGETCPKCGHPLVIRKNKGKEFVACSNYPGCKYIKKEEQVIEYTGKNCPDCGHPLVYRLYGKRKFTACSNYPRCKYTEGLKFKKKSSK